MTAIDGTTERALKEAAKALSDKKAMNVLAIDVRGISTLTEYFLIADGMVGRHVVALKNEVDRVLSALGISPVGVEISEDWIVVDYEYFVIHLFEPKAREFYRLEEVWKEGTLLQLEL